jgi:hypothetical protein
LAPEEKCRDKAGGLQGDAAGTADMAAMNYLERWRNAKSYLLGIAMAGASRKICGSKFMLAISLA